MDTDIILKYGVEIECVFELIDEYSTYIYFMKFYEKNYHNKRNEMNLIINKIMSNVNKIIIEEEPNPTSDCDEEITKIKENQIYIGLKEIFDKGDKPEYNEYLHKYMTLLIKKTINKEDISLDPISSEIPIFVNNLKEFLNLAIKLFIKKKIKYLIMMDDLLNMISEDEIFNNLNNVFDITKSNVKIYNINETHPNDFYELIKTVDKINLLLIYDYSVQCDRSIIYKNIVSPEVIKHKLLLNNCEFITQVLNNHQEIGEKSALFFNDTFIDKSLLNCQLTSQHVHISFNNATRNIKPDIKIILSIVCICHYFQDDIFNLFLITRSNNKYCKKLNYNFNYDKLDDYILTDDFNNNLIKILQVFYENDKQLKLFRKNRYFWLNLINLFKVDDLNDIDEIDEDENKKPYTIEFRIKHGSSDAEELTNVCKLYENIINFGIKLSKIISESNIITFKKAIDAYITKKDKDRIYHQVILKDIDAYFTNASSPYVIGLEKLNQSFLPPSIKGGKKQLSISKSSMRKSKSLIEKIIKKMEKMPIYKINSFGYEFIGYGLDEVIIERLKNKYSSTNKISVKEFTSFLKLHNIFTEIS